MNRGTVRPPTADGVRGTFADSPRLILAQAWAARWLLVPFALVVAVGSFLAATLPVLIDRTLDQGARSAIAELGDGAAVQVDYVSGRLDLGAGPTPDYLGGDEVAGMEASVLEHLPPILQQGAQEPWGVLASAPQPVTGLAKADDPAPDDVAVTLDRLAAPGRDLVRYISGGPSSSVPSTADGETVVVGVSSAIAAELGLQPGSRIAVDTKGAAFTAIVSGVFEPVEPDDPSWQAAPELLASQPYIPTTKADAEAGLHRLMGLLIDDDQVAAATATQYPGWLQGTFVIPIDAEAYDADDLPALDAAVTGIEADPSTLAPDVDRSRLAFTVSSDLDTALSVYQPVANAVRAQLSLAVVGLLGAAAVVLLLAARLVVLGRREALTLQHARGASGSSIAARLLIESAVVTALGAGAGILAARAAVGPADHWAPVLVVVVTALVAPAAMGTWQTVRSWAPQRQPANRATRGGLSAVRSRRRLVLEAFVVLLAVAAVAALRARGGLDDPSGGADLLLAAAPLLGALVAALLVVRAYPPALTALTAPWRRGRGAVGMLVAARARTAPTFLPLLGVTVCVSLGIAAVVLRTTIVEGEQAASWEQVGADLRAQGALPAAASEPGWGPPAAVSAVGLELTHAPTAVGSQTGYLTLLALDPQEWLAVTAGHPQPSLQAITDLAQPVQGGKLPVLIGSDAARALGGDPHAVYVGDTQVEVRVVGLIPAGLTSGWVDEPVMVVARDTLLQTGATDELGLNLLLSAGGDDLDGWAEQALPPGVEVETRAAWLEARSGSSLLHSLQRLLDAELLVLAGFVLLALLATVVSGAARRRRDLAALRVLGMRRRQGRWLAVGELAPFALAGVIGGALGAAGVLLLLAPALGLQEVTGGVAQPALALDRELAAALLLGLAALVVAIAWVEVMIHRRDRLAWVLREESPR